MQNDVSTLGYQTLFKARNGGQSVQSFGDA